MPGGFKVGGAKNRQTPSTSSSLWDYRRRGGRGHKGTRDAGRWKKNGNPKKGMGPLLNIKQEPLHNRKRAGARERLVHRKPRGDL